MTEICAQNRPDWDGIPVSGLQEALALATSPAGLILITLTLLAFRFRHQWGALVILVLWVGYVSLLTMADPTGTRALAQAEGCIGSPTLFIGAVAAICIGMIYYTTPSEARDT
jgi:hypothetical protein